MEKRKGKGKRKGKRREEIKGKERQRKESKGCCGPNLTDTTKQVGGLS